MSFLSVFPNSVLLPLHLAYPTGCATWLAFYLRSKKIKDGHISLGRKLSDLSSQINMSQNNALSLTNRYPPAKIAQIISITGIGYCRLTNTTWFVDTLINFIPFDTILTVLQIVSLQYIRVKTCRL